MDRAQEYQNKLERLAFCLKQLETCPEYGPRFLEAVRCFMAAKNAKASRKELAGLADDIKQLLTTAGVGSVKMDRDLSKSDIHGEAANLLYIFQESRYSSIP